jgi:two-component system alkaline phosphatase synthesis response regulator PhoP
MGKKRILLVDDEKSLTTLLKLNLEETGNYEVRVENWPEDAWPAAREFKPDLILLDIIMPRLPGGNVAAQIDADPELKNTPIVFLTAAVRKHQVEDNDGIISGRPCLAKPASLDEVIAMIESTLEKKPPQPEPRS